MSIRRSGLIGYEVKILKPGYAEWLGPTQQRADGTITLVKGPENIVVDTGGPWNRRALLRALKRAHVRPDDVSFVVCTHGHSDHTGNNNLFPNATLISSYDVCKGDLYTFHDFGSGQPYKIDDDVEVIATPGHTKQDVSVIVRVSGGIVAVVGDLFESADDLEQEELWRSSSEFPEEQEQNRQKILEMADCIVPGHGDVFAVRKGKAVALEPSQPRSAGKSEGSLRSRIVWLVIVPLVGMVAAGLLVWLITEL